MRSDEPSLEQTGEARRGPDDAQHGRSAPMGRRTVVAGTGILAVAAALAGCSSYGSQGAQGDAGGGATATGGADYPPPDVPSASPQDQDQSQGQGLARTADIPVGGGQVFPGEKVVVTQPESESFRAFSAICSHQGCTMKDVAGGTINCPCHGSKFAVADGSVVNGPAKRPLAPREVVVEGNWIRVV